MSRLNGARLETLDKNTIPESRNRKPITPSEIARVTWDSLPCVPSPDKGQDAILEPLKPKRGDVNEVRYVKP